MRTLASTVVYENPWITVREDKIEYPDGSQDIYSVVDKPDFALVLPRETDGFWLVEQFRYPIGRRAWEFPQGGWSHGSTGTQEDLARTELAEETGLIAGTLRHLGRIHSAYGFCSQGFDVFIATDLTVGTPNREATEADMIHQFFPDTEIEQMIRTGTLADSHSLAALSLYRTIKH